MWTYEDLIGVIANCTVRKKYLDGVHRMTQLIPDDGYCMHFIEDVGYTDEETGEYYPPTYSYTVILPPSVDVTTYEAVLITPDMDVNGDTNTEVM